MRQCPLALSEDVMVKGHWCAFSDNAMSDWSMFAVMGPVPVGIAGIK